MNYVVLILGMALITWVIRAAVFVLGDRLVFPPLVRTALGFVPVTVLTAIIVPMAVSPHGADAGAELTGAIRNWSARWPPWRRAR